jgi:deoxyribose-phosphate aldolase
MLPDNIEQRIAQVGQRIVTITGLPDRFYTLPLESPPAAPPALPLASLIDHTALQPDTLPARVEQLCIEARQYHFASVCINPAYVPLCVDRLAGSGVAVCTVVGFPLGATTPATKESEAHEAITSGANEIDMVLNIGWLKAEHYQAVLDDIETVAKVCQLGDAVLKVIIETALLTQDEKIAASLLAGWARADFVKTSTGFATQGATQHDVALIRRVVGAKTGVKASGGIRTRQDAEAMLAAGASRIGTSAGVQIVTS